MGFFVFILYSIFFGYFQSTSIYGGDAGDLVSAAFVGGIAHPPGYPLYSFLGFLISKIPISTVAWRIGLLSSIPSALALSILFLFIKKLTKSISISLITTAILACTYIFWLYSIVPEVFALHLAISISLLYALYIWSINYQVRYLYTGALLFGLGLAHHHIIIFLAPAIISLLWHHKKHLPVQKTMSIRLMGFFILGLIPYIWAYISALSVPYIVWNDPTTLTGFIQLVTRAQYGTFQAAIHYAQTLQSRLLQFPIILEFYITDFTYIGLALSLIGNIGLYRDKKAIFWYFLIGFLSVGPLFFFYASYIITSDFTLATMERFLLPSYIFITLWIGYGIHSVLHFAQRYLKTAQLIIIFFFVIPLSLFYINYPKLSILKFDRTAERIGEDVLKTTEPNSIILLQADTLIFNTQYVYFTYDTYKDRVPVHVIKLYNGEFNKIIEKYYPKVKTPQRTDPSIVISDFIERNYGAVPIYSTDNFPTYIEKSYWIPQGLIYKFYKEKDIPDEDELLKRSERVWQTYQDPLKGSLSSYRNLMLANVLDFYRNGRIRIGNMYLRADDPENALRHYQEALRLDTEYSDTYFQIADSYIKLGRCEKARKQIEKGERVAKKTVRYDPSTYYGYMYKLYDKCIKDEQEAEKWKKRYEKKIKEEETLLKEL
ncbi:hypothetical protein A3H80_03690 [Candidatus Roizmanbacteria bacterium RIFCSPLOWO2_02_FULL_37_19]|uniref:Uncharacterized protein n=1 Tax=Candidatus Roizmanbacteria bacterium RIFCSPHIGHO2_02_FULL_37_24 TaxID=1802037 RepID=A0A1F7GVE0_9BACT|nr:MAG: hypothetical protein A2862_01780 [Candidatus Roizmanbacteria bacterium RIFCSPHIGHO2_01_FULL_38_41]OGK22928.1 MAG: hypothetical protein A3C24_03650 [Candidatus Roizmanbacteria bacterium RIFCSPHIGHO2_02_FULL_37_24]OGK33618.1 MAG: hypothetical protein A3E10_05135 [Candidatus Roizmanbacteria bacterium RIFCSPHIGHO2_12_FULL_37_23]OGK44967.1 MAG: hypothetical protein A2956_00285 [Candidatus Roizmanbacteria bacterium RIFCSPLOWO2_01_FULL_37_57]OGK55270.1 MAG: hypothetical protein A3H80_03690 [Ca